MTVEEALVRLAESTADAVAKVLHGFAGDQVDRTAAAIVQAGASPFAGIPLPAVVARVDYVDGITGGNVFVMSSVGAQRLAAAMMGVELAPEQEQKDIAELELSAVGEATTQMMAAAAAATSAVLGHEVAISQPESRVVFTQDEAERGKELPPHATVVSFSVMSEPCVLIQLVPNAFVVRMTKALADLEGDMLEDGQARERGQLLFSPELLRRVPVRVSVELGRVRMPLARAVGLPAGAVVELDRAADDPVDLFVNGRRYAEGRLVLLEDNEWALRIDRLLGSA